MADELVIDQALVSETDSASVSSAVLTQAEKWNVLEQYAMEEGLSLFDVEYPASTSGVLRVFICGSGEKPGPVLLEQCSRISRRILDSELVEQLMPGGVTLEVSSPGVNRKLTRPEHFVGAVGERVKLKLRENTLGVAPVVVGFLHKVTEAGLNLTLEERVIKGKKALSKQASEGAQLTLDIPLDLIRDARINFKF